MIASTYDLPKYDFLKRSTRKFSYKKVNTSTPIFSCCSKIRMLGLPGASMCQWAELLKNSRTTTKLLFRAIDNSYSDARQKMFVSLRNNSGPSNCRTDFELLKTIERTWPIDRWKRQFRKVNEPNESSQVERILPVRLTTRIRLPVRFSLPPPRWSVFAQGACAQPYRTVFAFMHTNNKTFHCSGVDSIRFLVSSANYTKSAKSDQITY